MSGELRGPLVGIRVLELGNFIAAPFAAKIFADFGAEVIKVERPQTGDELRAWRTEADVTSMLFRSVARNKKSLTLDLRSPAGREIVLDLARQCDVIIENFRPGTLERWGIGPEALAAANPEVILVRISGYGQTGPYRDRPGFGSVAEAIGGLRFLTGEPDRPPVRAAASVADTVAGLYAVIGALMLMLKRARAADALEAGQLQTVDVALHEAVFSILESLVADYDAFGEVRARSGPTLPGVVPTGAYPCADGTEVVIGANSDNLFARLLIAMGRPDLAEDPKYRGGAARARHERELNALLRQWTLSLPAAEVVSRLQEAEVPVAPIYDAAGVAADEQFRAREMHVPFTVPVGNGEERVVRFPGIVPKLPGDAGAVLDAGPEVGQHTAEILRDLLGRDDAEIARLAAEGVI